MSQTMLDVKRDLAHTRERTHELVAGLSDAQLEAQVDPIMSPLVWDLGHIAAYEDLWLNHRHGGLPLLYPDLTAVYDAFETPRSVRGDIDILGATDARAYLAEVRTRTLTVLDDRGPDPVLHELVIQHELQHTETMRQAMLMGGLLSEALEQVTGDTSAWLHVPEGEFVMGAPDDGFSFDNERPAHRVRLGAYAIARTPVTNAAWAVFEDDGGYRRRELWSDEGWAWLAEEAVTDHPMPPSSDPRAPVCHVSWFEAEAFARYSDARLPSEAEWERAAPSLSDVGLVWEWTATEFTGYPGFHAHPYPEYSEVFFDKGYRCLRGGSWAASPRVATTTFRNWDLPQRRQIFAGVRLAKGEST